MIWLGILIGALGLLYAIFAGVLEYLHQWLSRSPSFAG
jgi:hypothetical protein